MSPVEWLLVIGGATLIFIGGILLLLTSFTPLSLVWIALVVVGIAMIAGAMIFTFKGEPPAPPVPLIPGPSTPSTPSTPSQVYSPYPAQQVGLKMATTSGNAKNIAMSKNGKRLFVATDTDSIDIYKQGASLGQWTLETTLARITTPYCHLATDATGTTLVVSTPEEIIGLNKGAVRILELTDPILMTWTMVSETTSPHATSIYGSSIGLSDDAYLLAVGDSGFNGNVGRVTILTKEPNSSRVVYQQITNPSTDTTFGSGLSLSGNGKYLMIYSSDASTQQGVLRAYERSAGNFTLAQTINEDPLSISGGEYKFGYRSALNRDGDVLVTTTGITPVVSHPPYNAPPYVGKIYIYRRSGSVWSREAMIVPPTSGTTKVTAGGTIYNNTVAINTLGDVIAVTLTGDASNRGTILCFRKEGTNWIKRSSLYGSDSSGPTPGHGTEISLSGAGSLLTEIDSTEMKIWNFKSI